MSWIDWLGLAFVFFMIAVIFPAASRKEDDYQYDRAVVESVMGMQHATHIGVPR